MEYSSVLSILILLTGANAEKYTVLDNPPLYEDITDVDYATEFEKRGTPNSNIWRFPWQYERLGFQGNALGSHIQIAETFCRFSPAISISFIFVQILTNALNLKYAHGPDQVLTLLFRWRYFP